MQRCDLKKNSYKRDQNHSRYHNSIHNLKFQHKQKYHLLENPRIKLDLLPSGQNSLSYYYGILYNNESKHNILALVGKANIPINMLVSLFSPIF
jgi:hypothetical protein